MLAIRHFSRSIKNYSHCIGANLFVITIDRHFEQEQQENQQKLQQNIMQKLDKGRGYFWQFGSVGIRCSVRDLAQ